MLCPDCFLYADYWKKHHKKTSLREVFLWCTRVDELLNSIVDDTSDITGGKIDVEY